MSFSTLPSIIKTFFIIFGSIYVSGKGLGIRVTQIKYCFILLSSLLATSVVYIVQNTFPLCTILSVLLFVIPFCCLFFHQPLSKTLCITILSIGSNYAVFAVFVVIMTPLISVLVFAHIPSLLIETITLCFIGLLETMFFILLFHTKRLSAGILNIINIFENNTAIFTGISIIIFSSGFYLNESFRSEPFHFLLIISTLTLGIVSWLLLQKSIQTEYIYKTHTQRIDMLEDTLRKKDAELERLSKIIHKDNKLLAALEHSTRELLTDSPCEKTQNLLQELNRFSKERFDTLSAYEEKPAPFPETGLFSIDIMLRYLYQKARKHKIDFQFQADTNISSVTAFISEQDLCTLIADLGENAIIATKDSDTKNILLSLEKRMQTYVLCIYDSGEAFSKEVLENLGKKRYTTHAETGGSGIGLMTTNELTKKYRADFFISDCEIPPPYTKQVSFMLNSNSPQLNR